MIAKGETMKSNTIHQIASLVMAFVMILGNTIHTQAMPVTAAGPSIYWGALVNADVPSSTNMQGSFHTFETRSGKKMSIIHWGQPWKLRDGSWGEFQTSYFSNVRNHGSIPMVNWGSHRLGTGATDASFQLRDIYNGAYDAYIKRWATDARKWGHPFFLKGNYRPARSSMATAPGTMSRPGGTFMISLLRSVQPMSPGSGRQTKLGIPTDTPVCPLYIQEINT
jgi:hypothetical protein